MSDKADFAFLFPEDANGKQNEVQGRKVIVSLRDQTLTRGYLQKIDHPNTYIRIRPIDENGPKSTLEIGFEDIYSLYYVHDFEQRLPQFRIESGSWNKIFQNRASGTIAFRKVQGKWAARFKKSELDLGGVFLEPMESESNVLKVFFPFPEVKPDSGVNKLGEKLLSEGFISQEELEAGLRKQSEMREKRIGDILVEQGRVQYLTEQILHLRPAKR